MLRLDVDDSETGPVLTDRNGVARFEVPAGSGRVPVSGVERFHGRFDAKSRRRLGALRRIVREVDSPPELDSALRSDTTRIDRALNLPRGNQIFLVYRHE